MNAAEHLAENAWKHPRDYGGFSPDGDYLVLSRNRDSDLLSESNWDYACRALGAEAYDGGSEYFSERPAVYHWRAGHWACGWVEYLMVRADADESVLTAAGDIVCSLADYPVLDESDYSDRECEAVNETWERASVSERVKWLQWARMNIFAARRDEFPRDDNGALFDRLRD